MSKIYDQINLGINFLVGKKVKEVFINEDNDAVTLKTETGNIYLSWCGECSNNCYIAHFNNPENLIKAEILKAEHTEWSYLVNDGANDNVVESMGTKIKTTKGYVDIETRVSHNGYYGGMINVSNVGFLAPYGGFREAVKTKIPITEF